MSDDLKPCPFCTEGKSVSTYFDHEQGDKWGYAACDACGSRGPEVRTGYDRADDALWRAEAITSWNTRTPDTSIEALTAKNEMLGREVNIARYGQPNFAWSVHVQVMDDLNTKLEKAMRALERAKASIESGGGGGVTDVVWLDDPCPETLCDFIDATLAEIEGKKG